MTRVVLYIFLAIIIITFIRAIAGVIGKAVSGMVDSDPGAQSKSESRAGGDLRKDPVCGTYVSSAISVKKTIGKEVVHFCSPKCLEEFDRQT